MHSAETRDAMVARVNDAFAKHRVLAEWPVKAKWDLSAAVNTNVPPEKLQEEYVKALYTICAEGVVTGRLKDEPTLVGDKA